MLGGLWWLEISWFGVLGCLFSRLSYTRRESNQSSLEVWNAWFEEEKIKKKKGF